MYKLQGQSIKRLSDGASIPMVNGNIDYEEYKQWLSEGNTPESEFTEAELLAKTKHEIEQAIQAMLDAKAKEYRWDDMKSARAGNVPVKDTDSDIVVSMKQNAAALTGWYFEVWAKAIEIESSGIVYTAEEVLAQMPVYVG